MGYLLVINTFKNNVNHYFVSFTKTGILTESGDVISTAQDTGCFLSKLIEWGWYLIIDDAVFLRNWG